MSTTKNTFLILALPALIITQTAHGMQLSNSHKKEIIKICRNKEKNIDGTILINNPSGHMHGTDRMHDWLQIVEVKAHLPITYTTKNDTNISAEHNEPFVNAIIINKKTNKRIQFQKKDTLNVPAKIFANSTDGSKVSFKTTANNAKYNFSLICAKNNTDLLRGDNFKQQFDICMEGFYAFAPVNEDDEIETLVNSNIIRSDITQEIALRNHNIAVFLCAKINEHSENGCSNEDKFIKQIINTSPLKSGHNKTIDNIYTSLMGRQHGNKNLFKQLQ